MEQKAINIVGSIIVGASMLAIGGTVKMILDLKTTVNKADVNTKEIDNNNKVLHRRVSQNHNDIDENKEQIARIDERSRINRQDIINGR